MASLDQSCFPSLRAPCDKTTRSLPASSDYRSRADLESGSVLGLTARPAEPGGPDGCTRPLGPSRVLGSSCRDRRIAPTQVSCPHRMLAICDRTCPTAVPGLDRALLFTVRCASLRFSRRAATRHPRSNTERRFAGQPGRLRPGGPGKSLKFWPTGQRRNDPDRRSSFLMSTLLSLPRLRPNTSTRVMEVIRRGSDSDADATVADARRLMSDSRLIDLPACGRAGAGRHGLLGPHVLRISPLLPIGWIYLLAGA